MRVPILVADTLQVVPDCQRTGGSGNVEESIFTTCLLAPLVGTPAMALDKPYAKPDGSWISLSGEVTEVHKDAFTLDYGPNKITVEMDDGDWYDESKGLLQGDKVTVYGVVDDDFYETSKIEASSVFVQGLGTYFYASSADEEGGYLTNSWLTAPVVQIGDVTLNGTVKQVDGRTFTIDTGTGEMRVDTSQMAYNPVDEKGFQKIEKGDVVSVSGDLELNTFTNRELMADTVITLYDKDDSRNRSSWQGRLIRQVCPSERARNAYRLDQAVAYRQGPAFAQLFIRSGTV